MRRDGEVCVGGQYPEVVEVVCGAAIVPVRVLELTKIVEGGDLAEGELWKGECEMSISARKRRTTHIVIVL